MSLTRCEALDRELSCSASETSPDTAACPWHVVHSDDKKRMRLNLISHLLSQIPYEDLPVEKVKLPKRHVAKADETHPLRFITETY